MFKIDNINFAYKKGEAILKDVSLNLESGKILAIVGPSGGGKSTLLRIISGLEDPESGSIKMMDQEISHLKPEKRKVGMLFQDYALFPHMTVYKNLAYALKEKNKKSKIKELLALVDMSGYEKRYPHELSGGQQQRIALARTLASEPHILLLDEPFSNLDGDLIHKIRGDMFNLIRQLDITTIMVTHNTEDTNYADHVLKMENGHMVTLDSSH